MRTFALCVGLERVVNMQVNESGTSFEELGWQTGNPHLSLALKHDELLMDLHRLFERTSGLESWAAAPGEVSQERPAGHRFVGTDEELIALIAAIRRLGLRATIVAQPQLPAWSVPVTIEL